MASAYQCIGVKIGGMLKRLSAVARMQYLWQLAITSGVAAKAQRRLA
jgi:hypothetical protein